MSNPTQTQVGGTHYKDMQIQPAEFCQRNQLGYCESNVVKYVCRHKHKGGRQDIEKAIHYLQLLLGIEYPVEKSDPPEPQWCVHTPGDSPGPLPCRSRVEVKFRDGAVRSGFAHEFEWGRHITQQSHLDIIAWRPL